MKATRHNCTPGFTLIEILVTISLIILLMFLVGYPILTGFAFMEKGVARADAQSAARLAIDAMTRELAEAMYVFDLPVGGIFVAFLPARSWSPAAADQKAPIEPQASAIRYWRALRDPALEYWPFYSFDSANPNKPVNPEYLARSVIALPTARDDPWNNSSEALTRAAFWYAGGYSYGGETWPTAQPGYPWLEAVRQFGAGPPPPQEAYDLYRELAVGLTPNNVDYNVPSAGFSPARITEEALVPWTSAFPRDYSRYRARYPLWADFAQWDPGASNFALMGLIKLYRYEPYTDTDGNGRYDLGEPFTDLNGDGKWDRALAYQTAVDATNGEVWVVRVSDGSRLYNIGAYPQRNVGDANQAECAFGIDYDRGEVRFDFPAQEPPITSTGASRYSLSTAAGLTDAVVVNGSTSVWVRDPSTGATTYYNLYAYAPPLDPSKIGADEYAVEGTDVVFNATSPPAAGLEINVTYRYRNNPENQLVVATYATKAIVNISLTVSKRDIAARTPAASRQDVTLVAKVKLKNVPR